MASPFSGSATGGGDDPVNRLVGELEELEDGMTRRAGFSLVLG
jgi:hypothetical protein